LQSTKYEYIKTELSGSFNTVRNYPYPNYVNAHAFIKLQILFYKIEPL